VENTKSKYERNKKERKKERKEERKEGRKGEMKQGCIRRQPSSVSYVEYSFLIVDRYTVLNV
jgi:hypothetical protein